MFRPIWWMEYRDENEMIYPSGDEICGLWRNGNGLMVPRGERIEENAFRAHTNPSFHFFVAVVVPRIAIKLWDYFLLFFRHFFRVLREKPYIIRVYHPHMKLLSRASAIFMDTGCPKSWVLEGSCPQSAITFREQWEKIRIENEYAVLKINNINWELKSDPEI